MGVRVCGARQDEAARGVGVSGMTARGFACAGKRIFRRGAAASSIVTAGPARGNGASRRSKGRSGCGTRHAAPSHPEACRTRPAMALTQSMASSRRR